MNYKIIMFYVLFLFLCSCKKEQVYKQLNTDVYEDSVYTLNDYNLRGEVKELKEYEKDTTKPSTYTFDEFGNLEDYWSYDEGKKYHVYENEIENGKVIKFSHKSLVNHYTYSYPIDEFEYDENYNLIKMSSLNSKESTPDAWIEYKYDKDNRLIGAEHTVKRSGSRKESATSRFEYDEKGRSSKKIDDYNGRVRRVNNLYYLGDGVVVDSVSGSIDGEIHGFVEYVYDGDNLISRTENYFEGTEVKVIRTNTYTYNDKGDVLEEKEDFTNNEYDKDKDVEYKYLEYDTEGNWLARETYENRRLKKTHTRKIEYYRRKYLF